MGKVINLNNITKLDLPADRIIDEAHGKLESAIVIGYDKDGEEYFTSSLADGGSVLWLLERMKLKLLESADEE